MDALTCTQCHAKVETYEMTPRSEHDLRQVLIDMKPISGQAHVEGDTLWETCLLNFCEDSPFEPNIFAGYRVATAERLSCRPTASAPRTMDQCWACATAARGQQCTKLAARYLYEAYAGFHVIQLLTEGAPILLFSDPTAVPHASPWNLCAARNLGSMNPMWWQAGHCLGVYSYPMAAPLCCLLVHEKVMQGASRAADYRAYRRIAPKLFELVVVSKLVAFAFCERLLLQQPAEVEYFDPASDWPQPIELHATFPIVLEELAFLGDTRSRCELLVFAQATRHDSLDDGHPSA